MLTEEVTPVLLVALFGVSQRKENVAFLACAPASQFTVHRTFGLFVGKVTAPTANLP